jgi:hypothetical protein
MVMMTAILLWAALWIAAIILLVGLTIIVVRNIRRYLREHCAISEGGTTSTASRINPGAGR